MENLLGRFLGLTVILSAVCYCIHCQTPGTEEFKDPRDTSPPSITLQPEPSRGYDLKIMDKRIPLKLSCQASGTLEPRYKWFKYDPQGENQVELDPDDPRVTITGGNLVLGDPEMEMEGEAVQERVNEDDQGLYQCVAENVIGSALSKKINASIAFLDSFDWVESKRVTAQVGEKVVLNCDPPKGVPPSYINIYWSFGDPGTAPQTPVELNDRVLQDKNGNLVFANIQTQDEYDYMCNVPNPFVGKVKMSPFIEVIVQENRPAPDRGPTWVYKPPTSTEVLRTKMLQLKCIAEGNPTPQITWRRGGGAEMPLQRLESGPQGSTLEIRDITFADDGEYICEAENGVGAAITYTSTVTVRAAPYWDPNPPTDTTIAPKESVTITCQAGGSPASAVSWLVNGKEPSELPNNPRLEINSGQGSGQIIVSRAQQTDSAVFQCVAKNEYGEEITSVFLNVLAIPAEIRKRPEFEYEISEGSKLAMRCEPYGKPDPTVTWSFEGNVITPGGRYAIETSGSERGTLTITDVTVEDSGSYSCNVSNDFGAQDASPRVTVRMQTRITEGPGGIEVEANENIILGCEVESDPNLELTVQWLFNGVEIDPDLNKNRYIVSGDNTLTVIAARKGDGGEYTCKAITTISEDSAVGVVTVLTVPDPPINVVVYGARVDTSGLDATVEWMPGADSNTPITEYSIEYKTEYNNLGWITGKTVAASTMSVTLTLKAGNTYYFRMKATNKVGKSAASEMSPAHMTPEKAPSVNPSNVKGTGQNPGVMVVSWDRMHPVDYAGPVFKYVVRYRAKGANEWTEKEVAYTKNEYRVVDDTVKFQQYEVQVIARNNIGLSTAQADTITGYSGESEPTAAPTSVSVEVLDATTITVKWKDVPEDSINGQVLGYTVFISIVIAAGSNRQAQVFIAIVIGAGSNRQECEKSPCVISNLQPYNAYELQLAVRNGKGFGPKSDTFRFETPEGEPSGVNNLQLRASSDRILATWEKPDAHNGVLRGYVLTYNTLVGLVVGDPQVIEVNSTDTMRQIIDGLDSESKYRITVQARTGGGAGKEEYAEISTRPEGKPREPGKPQFDSIGPTSMNIAYKPDPMGPAVDFISVKCYKKKGEEPSDAKESDKIDIFEEDAVHVTGLTPSTNYIFQIVAKNKYGERTGEWEEARTSGAGAVTDGGFKVEAWFIVVIVIVILLLLILLIVCVLASQQRDTYDVSDKEQQLKGDIESTPLKDEGGFEEFQPREQVEESLYPKKDLTSDICGNMDNALLTGGSHASLNESDTGSSETDSLKEYADGDTGKFNEDSSFIGQYGDRKTRPPDEGQDTAAYSTFVSG